MRRPGVLHVVRDWVRPSEGFIADVVRTTTATRAAVATRVVWPGSPAGDVRVRVHELGARPGRPERARLARAAVRERAALLHAHFGYTAEPTARVAARLHRPWLVSLHGHDLLVEARADPGLLRVIRAAPLVVVPSGFLADAAADAGVPEGVLRIVPSGVALPAEVSWRVRRATGAAVDGAAAVLVVVPGRFVEKKGTADAARALARAQARYPELRAIFVGFGPGEAQLRELLEALGLPAQIRDGAVPGAVAAALAEADVVLTCSRTAADGDAESLGLVNLEALARGVPVVSTRHGGIPEAVPETAGVLCPPGDVEALADAVVALAADPARRQAMGFAGRRHVAAAYELGARVADLEELYLGLLATRRARSGGSAPARPAGVRAPCRDTPRVSVVVVTHRRRPLVLRTVAALQAQTYPAEALELLVVDNASGDGTAEALEALTTSGGPALWVLREERAVSVARARNRAVAAASGEVVAFTDDDCRPRPTWVEALVAGRRAGVGIVQGRTTADPAQRLRPLSRTQFTPAEYGAYETCNIAYTRAALAAAGTGPDGSAPFDESLAAEVARVLGRRFARLPFGEDTELAWRTRRAGVASRFAATAVVEHEVFDPDLAYLLRRAWVGAAFPLLVRHVPELRGRLLTAGFLLGPSRARHLGALAGVGLAAARRDPRWLAAGLPYVQALLTKGPGRPRERARAAPARCARDTVETVALVYGSLRARRLVL